MTAKSGVRVVVAALCVALLPATVWAEEDDLFYTGQTMSFDFSGTIDGTFQADGSVKDFGDWPPTSGSATVGVVSKDVGAVIAAAQGWIVNGDGTFDLAIVTIMDDTMIEPGNYEVLMGEATLAFFDNLDQFGGTPEHSFFSTSGTVTISSADETTVTGTFNGTLSGFAPQAEITVTGGQFQLTGGHVVPTQETTWGQIKSMY